ncbi:MAG: DUF2764 domain-containing protein [Treponema sp.]|nr:DUF2764 domain-containing protein [Treponema sp.]
MGSYYYLAAQLPYLIYGQQVPMSSSAFKELAKGAMDKAEGDVLDFCALGFPGHAENRQAAPEFVRNWLDWERVLRLNLARGRAQKLRRDGSDQRAAADAPEYPADAANAAKAALAQESPLEAEILLDKARWAAIENLQGIDAFSETAMYAYLLKLLLMERRQAFKTEEGFSEYKTLYASILENAEKSSDQISIGEPK